MVPVADLAKMRNSKNTNDHTPEQIDELVEQFMFQGVRHPIIVSNRDGLIAAGDGRFQAAELAGMKEYPVDFQDFESEEQQFAFGVADNELQKWSMTSLKKIHAQLPQIAPFDIKRLAVRNFEFEPNQAKEKELDETLSTDHECPKCGYVW